MMKALATNNKHKTLIIACGALSHEIFALIKTNQWSHLAVTCLPAHYHHRPALIPEALRKKIRQNRDQYPNIYVMYGDCGTGGLLDKVLEDEQVSRIDGPHCFSFFSGNKQFDEWSGDEITTFYLTDFFCRYFETFVWEALGLDRRDDMAEFVFGNYKKVVFIAQTENPELQAKAKQIAKRLKLEYEYRFTGYGDMRSSLASLPVRTGPPRDVV
ncbi:MAG: DUF1638 domain-containing protein [Gammaproteobacteria bacterium]|nr:DUF1638 domain-containing protein [Gammaproteobacteria bacterium]